jgi:hypothetical protein
VVATALWLMECGCHGILGSRVWLPWCLGKRLVAKVPLLPAAQLLGVVCRVGSKLLLSQGRIPP